MQTIRRSDDFSPNLDRLREARDDRRFAVETDLLLRPPTVRRDEDITVAGIVDRRARCRRCKYPFDYRMYGMVCPECGTLRDDYPARLISPKQFFLAVGVGTLLFAVVMWWMAS